MLIRIAHPAAVEDERVIEERSPSGVACSFARNLPNSVPVRVDLGHLGDVLRVVAVVRHRMVLLVDAELRVRAALSSRSVMNVATRVRSAWYATASRSHISVTCSSNDSGMPTGSSTDVTFVLLSAAARWIRRSISRTFWRYSSSRARSSAELALHVAGLPGDLVEDAQVALPAGAALFRRAGTAEHALEHRAWIELHRLRRGR